MSEIGQSSVTGNIFVPSATESFGYDKDGNLTNDGRWSFSWDAENRLISMQGLTSIPTGAKFKLDFIYDWMGRRIQKLVSTNNGSSYFPQSTNRFLYDGWNLIAILNPQTAVLQSFMWGLDLSGSQQGAGGVGGLLGLTDSTNGSQFSVFDGNGNSTALVKATDGSITALYEYGPFGELIRATGPMARANPFRFSTKYQDDESDLLYYGYRYYNTSTGKWLSSDPIGEWGGYNVYGFVLNAPVRCFDLLGLIFFPPILFDPPPIIVDPIPAPPVIIPAPQPPITIPIPLPPQVPPMPLPPILFPPYPNPNPNPSPSPAPNPQPSGPLPPDQGGPPWPYGDDGDCTPARKQFLQHQKNAICNQPRSCRKCQDDANEIWRRIRINEDCIRARQNLMNECYRGGDQAHKDEVENVRRVLNTCLEAYRALGGI